MEKPYEFSDIPFFSVKQHLSFLHPLLANRGFKIKSCTSESAMHLESCLSSGFVAFVAIVHDNNYLVIIILSLTNHQGRLFLNGICLRVSRCRTTFPFSFF